MPPMIVSTLFKGKDLLTPIFKRQSVAVGKFGDKASRSFNRASRSATRFGDIVKGVLTAGLIQRGVGALARGTRVVTEEFVDFDQALTRAGAKFPEVVKRGTDSFNRLGAVARKVGAETQFTAADAARGLDFLAMAGFNAEQAMVALPGVTDLATIANTDLARSTDIATDALGAFGLMSKDTAQLQTNLARINDVMAATVTSANTDIEQLYETMKFAGPVATTAGASIETFSTLVAEMANAGIKGSLAGTALRTGFIALTAPAAKGQRMLNRLGVSVKDSSGNMRDMLDILDDIRRGTSKMGTAQRTAALNTIFGRRAVAGMSVVLNASNEQLHDYRRSLEDAGGASRRMAGDIQKSIGNRLKQLKSALIEIGFRFLEAFVGKGEKGLDALIEAIRRFDVKPIVEGIKRIASIVSTVYDGIKLLGKTFNWIVDIFNYAIDHIGTLIVVFGLLKAAIWAVNVAMYANPIGILIAAIGVLIAVINILADNWNSASATIEMSVMRLRDIFLTAFENIRNFVLGVINDIIRGINAVFGTDIKKFEIPDNSAKIKREIGLIQARNKLLIGAVKDSEELQQRALIVGESLRGQQRAAAARQFETPEFETEFAPVEQSIDPELLRQQISFSGDINLRNAPKGATFEGKTRGAPPIKTAVLGVNP